MTDSSLTQAPGRKAMVAIRLVFAMESMSLGAWLPRIPDIRNALGLNDAELGIALVGAPAGTLIGFLVAARIASTLGLRMTCMVAGAIFALSFILVGLAANLVALIAALVVAGFIVALVEVGMNTKAGGMEKAAGRRIMSQCHGFWSIGAVIGALIGGAFSQLGISPLNQFIVTGPIFAVIAWTVASWLEPDVQSERATRGPSFFTLPDRRLLLLCAMPVGIMALEGAFMDWSAVFARDVLAAEPAEAAAIFAVFAAVMAATRLVGDALATRFGAAIVVLASSLAAAAGATLFVTATGLAVAFVAAALAGFGVAVVYPLAVSAAAASPGRSPEDNVASVSFIAFSVFLAGPPIIGFLAEAFGLRTALAILIPAALVSAALSWTVRPRS